MSRAQRSDSDSSEGPGAAQFLTNLSPHEIQHLQLAVLKKEETESFSQFLEEPRNVPVPKRFMFNPAELARLKENQKDARKENGTHARKGSVKSRQSGDGSSRSDVHSPSRGLLVELKRVASADWRFYTTGVCLCVMNLVAAWDATAISIALPTIATRLGGSTFETFWVPLSFFVTATSFLPLFAALSDTLGRKPIVLTGLAFFTIGSFIAAVAGNFTVLLLGRSIQGVGAGGIYPLSNLILSDLVSEADRVKWSAIVGATWVIGAVTGPLIGGVLAQHGQWRWVFWLNLPFCTLVFFMLAFFAHLKPASPGPLLSKLRNVDWFGFILLSGSLVSAFLGLTWGGISYNWSSVQTILSIQCGVFGLLVFIVWSWYSLLPSLVSLDGFIKPMRLATYLGAMIQGILVWAALYFLPLYFGVARHSYSAVQIAGSLCAWSVPLASLALISFFVGIRTTMHCPMAWFAWFLIVLGSGLMTILTRDSGAVMWLCIAVFSGSGVGILYPTLSVFALSDIPCGKEDCAITNLAFFQTLGQTLGVAVGSAVFQNQLYKQLLRNQALEASSLGYVKDAFRLVNIFRDQSGTTDTLRTEVSDGYVAAVRMLWIVMAVFAGVAMLTSFLLKIPGGLRTENTKDRRLGKEYQN